MHPLRFKKLEFNCVSAPPTEVADFIVERFTIPSSFQAGQRVAYKLTRGQFCWRDAYVDVPAQGWRPLVCILWEPQNSPGHTVFMSNSSDGMSFSVSKLSKNSVHKWCHISIGDHPSLPWHNASFRYYFQASRREILVANNERGKWEFIETGEPLPFESMAQYKKPAIRDRLNRELIYRYLCELDYHVEAEEFWSPISSVKLWQEVPQDPNSC